ncbi:MAG: DUF3466 family protein [Phycisphaeraceae bacterium]|nr:DUF3466 family protein [Phycisphaeraceae bacterium]
MALVVRCLSIVVVSLALCASARAAITTRYVLHVLPTLGGSNAYAYAINNLGQVVGEAQRPDGLFHAVLWSNQGLIRDLGDLGYNRSAAYGINELGQVVGRSFLTERDPHAFIWTAGAGMKDLGTLGGTSSLAVSINNLGVMVGQADVLLPDWSTQFRAAQWSSTNSGPVSLSSLGGKYSHGASINDTRQVAGHAYNAQGQARAVRWSSSGAIQELGTFGGARSWATAINLFGQVVGRAEDANGNAKAFFWNGATKTNLGTLGGANSSATSLNNLGLVVGVSDIPQSDQAHGFIWSAGKGMTDLNSLITPGSGWTVTSANDINDLGVIVGWATNGQGSYQAVALTPAKPGDFNGDGVINIQDINPFVAALQDQLVAPPSTAAELTAMGDLNGDGQFSVQDINPFLDAIAGSQGVSLSLTTIVPEPATPMLLLAGWVIWLGICRTGPARRHAMSAATHAPATARCMTAHPSIG